MRGDPFSGTNEAWCDTCNARYWAPEAGMVFICSPRCFGTWLRVSMPWRLASSSETVSEPRTLGDLLRLSRLYMEELAENPSGGATGAVWTLLRRVPGADPGRYVSYLSTARSHGFIPRFPLTLPWEPPMLTPAQVREPIDGGRQYYPGDEE